MESIDHFHHLADIQTTWVGVPTVAGPGNLEAITVPALILGLFVLVGVVRRH